MILLSLVGVVALVAAHLFGQRLYTSGLLPREVLLSGASGVSVAFVFVHLLPALSQRQDQFEASGPVDLDHHLYVVALAGLVVYYGIEWLVLREEEPGTHPIEVFRVHLSMFALYNLLIGYLLIHYAVTPRSLLLFVLVLVLHMIGNDHALREIHRARYHNRGRWLLGTTLVMGWLLGILVEVGSQTIAIFFAFLAGSLLVNVLKEELPEEQPRHFGAFMVGVVVVTLLELM